MPPKRLASPRAWMASEWVSIFVMSNAVKMQPVFGLGRPNRDRIINDEANHAHSRIAKRRALPALALVMSASAMLAARQTPPDIHAVCPLDTTGVLVGRVEAQSGIVGPFVVVARERGSGKIAQRTFVTDTRDFAMLMNAGRYDFFALSDLDGNGRRGPDEPASAVYALRPEVRAADLIELPTLRIDLPAFISDR